MNTHQFIMTYPIPFAIVFIVMGLNEYRLYRANIIDYKSLINGIAMLISSLLSFMVGQAVLSTL